MKSFLNNGEAVGVRIFKKDLPQITTDFLVIELSSRRGRDRDDSFPLKEKRIRGHFFYLFLYFFLED